MHILLDAIFLLFGKKALGRVTGAAVIGVLVVGWHFLRSGERPPVGEFSTWLIFGALAGFTAGLILVSPRVFFATLFGLLGLAIVVVPMSHVDGTPATLGEHAVKVGIGVGLILLSVIFIVPRPRKVAGNGSCEPDVAAQGGQPIRSRTSRTSSAAGARR